MRDTVYICAACLEKLDIHFNERSLDLIKECDVCDIPDACLTLPKATFKLLEANHAEQNRCAKTCAAQAR